MKGNCIPCECWAVRRVTVSHARVKGDLVIDHVTCIHIVTVSCARVKGDNVALDKRQFLYRHSLDARVKQR